MPPMFGPFTAWDAGGAASPTGDLPAQFTIHNTSVSSNSGVALWGQEFEQGALPSGSALTATGWNVQTNVLSTYSDGSARFAAMAAQPTSAIAGSSSQAITLTIGSGASGAAIATSDLTATQLAQVDIGGGMLRGIDRDDLELADTGRRFTRVEYSGPLCTCWIYQNALTDGAEHDNLDAQFIIWGGPSGTILRQRSTLENTRLNPTTAADVTTTVIIDHLGVEVVNRTSRAVNELRRGSYFVDNTDFHVEKDMDYTYRVVGLMTAYSTDADTAANTTQIGTDLTAINGDAEIFDNQFVTFSTGGGTREELNHFPGWTARAYVDADNPDGLNVMERVCSSAGGMNEIHFRDETTGLVPLVGTYLSATNNWTSGLEGRTAHAINDGTIDFAHYTSFGFAEYLWTGDPYYREEAMMWGFWAAAGDDENYVSASVYGTVFNYQIRGVAWRLRSLVHAWWVTRDSESTFQDEMTEAITSTASELETEYGIGGAERVVPYIHHLGQLAPAGTGNDGYTSQWMDDWLSYWCMQGSRLGIAALDACATYFGNFAVQRMIHPDFRAPLAAISWPWVGTNYATGNETTEPTTPTVVGDLINTWDDYRQSILYNILNIPIPTDTGYSIANRTNALAASDADLYTAITGMSDSREFPTYNTDPDSYVAYLRSCLAIARDMSIPTEREADIAWRRFLTFDTIPSITGGAPQAAHVPSATVATTALGTAMAAASLNTLTVFNPASGMTAGNFQSPDTSQSYMTYMGTTEYDPVNRRFYLLSKAQGSGTDYVFSQYDLATDTFSVISSGETGSYPGTGASGHGYDGHAVDPTNGNYYYHGALDGSGEVGVYNGTSWSSLTGTGLSSSDTPTGGFMAQRREVVMANNGTSTLRVYNVDTDTWSSGGAISLASTAHMVGGVNPIRHEFIFGGGDNASGGTRVRTMYRYSNDGQLTQLADLPINGGDASTGYGLSVEDGALFGVDYTTGETIIFWYNRSFSLTTVIRLNEDQTWSTAAISGTTPAYGACCVTIPELNGNVLMDYNGGSPRFLLYRTR